MTALERYVGQTLDEKYRLECLLGQGGMGAVYLATHLGTERYVALKLIAPQFMRNEEFVERFKREARAAGRLRHPNVVDVTDFGFSGSGNDRVAYLVMEYLDGCTLSDVLAEEDRLPLYWAVDILEQVCAAVHEAHQQGIVHRDLKPDNIWLEPNGLGGYRVKVLDFGIAKLAEASSPNAELIAPSRPPLQPAEDVSTLVLGPQGVTTLAAIGAQAPVRTTLPAPPKDLEAATLIQPLTGNEADTKDPPKDSNEATRLFEEARSTGAGARLTSVPLSTAASAGLTRVGAILGTPLYMSPEQCRGERLDARSDVYSLGIIAYQMLTGSPPFTGETRSIIRAHTESAPAPVRNLNKKLPKRVARAVMWALEKDKDARPQTAIAFSGAIRANADGLGALYRRAFSLYSEYFPEFLKLSLLAHVPVFIVMLMTLAFRIADKQLSKPATIAIGIPIALLSLVSKFLTGSIISGVTAIIVTQLAVMPMKPVRLRAAFDVLRQRWRPFFKTGILLALRILLGWILCIVPGIVMAVRYYLWAPVVLMEGLETKVARLRARALASRSWRTVILVILIQFLVPIVVSSIVGGLIGFKTSEQMQSKVRFKIFTQFAELINVFVLPLTSIVPALLYLKMRQLGGETLTDVMAQLEDVDGAKSLWQQRMRTRLTVTPQSRTPM
ncbi:MAG TPA: serine/threonine-protein kinase [Pyrinomonadaceae bacterium]|nr:serine/threonine-protein kinase [Pyrinomonadaceae bacterium]